MKLYHMTPIQVRAAMDKAIAAGDTRRAAELADAIALLQRIGEAFRTARS